MLKKMISPLALALVVFVFMGGGLGFLSGKGPSFSQAGFGTVTAHECIILGERYCGAFWDQLYGSIEVSRYTKATEMVRIGSANGASPFGRRSPPNKHNFQKTTMVVPFRVVRNCSWKHELKIPRLAASTAWWHGSQPLLHALPT